jgi:hypothetical protein
MGLFLQKYKEASLHPLKGKKPIIIRQELEVAGNEQW